VKWTSSVPPSMILSSEAIRAAIPAMTTQSEILPFRTRKASAWSLSVSSSVIGRFGGWKLYDVAHDASLSFGASPVSLAFAFRVATSASTLGRSTLISGPQIATRRASKRVDPEVRGGLPVLKGTRFKEAIAWLAKEIPKAEHTMPKV
jgi:hypothetical protein